MTNNYNSKKNASTEEETAFSNCHRTGDKKATTSSAVASETDSDQDSANSKYVVTKDDRERRDGPGGN